MNVRNDIKGGAERWKKYMVMPESAEKNSP